MNQWNDGVYTVEVTLTGGTGKVSLTSPTELTVENGSLQAKIEWSSSHYDYMVVGDQAYTPSDVGETSVFYVTIPALDEDIPIQAETTAMSQPHMIDYTLHFDSATLQPAEGESAGTPTLAVGLLIAVVAVLAAAAVAAAVRRRGRKGR